MTISYKNAALVIITVLLVVVFTLFGALLFVSPGTPKPFLEKNGNPLVGSISEKITVRINGADQGMFIKAQDSRHQVLLYLHGGMPDYFLTQRYPTGLDEDFVVVWWEQRGSGLSFDARAAPELVNAEQLIRDTLAVTNYLRQRFGQDKIYLMGHSGGTFIGIQAAAQAPELYHAYIGVAQISNQFESERLAYNFMRQRFKDDRNSKMVTRLDQAPIGNAAPLSAAYANVRDVAMHQLGVGTMHNMRSILTGLFFASLLNREYTLGEKIRLWRGKIFSSDALWNTQLSTDLTIKVTLLDLRVYFFHGVYDYTVSYPLAKSYCQLLVAPVKGFYTFKHSAHSTLFEEPERTLRIMRTDVLAGTQSLADPR